MRRPSEICAPEAERRGVAGRAAHLRAAAGERRRSPGAPASGRSVPRHAAVQRAHHRKRRAVGGAAGADVHRHDFSGARRGDRCSCALGLARTGDPFSPGLRGASAEDRAATLRCAPRSRTSSRAAATSCPLFDTKRSTRNIEAAYHERCGNATSAGERRRRVSPVDPSELDRISRTSARSICPRPGLRLAKHAQHAALEFGRIRAGHGERTGIGLAVGGIIDLARPLSGPLASFQYDLVAQQRPGLLAGVGVVLVELGPAGRRIDRLLEPDQRAAERTAAIGYPNLTVPVGRKPGAKGIGGERRRERLLRKSTRPPIGKTRPQRCERFSLKPPYLMTFRCPCRTSPPSARGIAHSPDGVNRQRTAQACLMNYCGRDGASNSELIHRIA